MAGVSAPRSSSPPRNQLLAAMSAPDFALLGPHLRPVALELLKDLERGQIIAVAGNQAHRARVQAGHNPEAVVLDFVHPARPSWRQLRREGRQGSIAPARRRATRSRNKTMAIR